MESCAGWPRGWIEQHDSAPYIEQSGPPARPPDWGFLLAERLLPRYRFVIR